MVEYVSDEIFIKLYLDEDISQSFAGALMARGFDVISAREIGKFGLTDAEQLKIAVSQGRTLFTFNTPDYLQLHLRYLSSKQEHWGIIVSGQIPIKELIRRSAILLNTISRDEMKNQILYLQAFK